MKRRIIAAFVSISLVGVLLTQPTANDLNLDLPAAIQGIEESPVVARIGVVIDFVEADSITVRISGSPSLVNASFAFPWYEPVLGDRVYVIRQDSQWFVLGTMSGPINSLAPNASFELGTLGGGIPPTDWTVTNISTPAGAIAGMEKSLPPASASQRGLYVAAFGAATAGTAGTAVFDAFSTPVPAAEGQNWIAAITILDAVIDHNAAQVSQGGLSQGTLFVDFRDAGGVVLTSTQMSTIAWTADDKSTHLLRPAPGITATAPVNTATAVFRMRWSLALKINSNTQVFADDAILRRVS
jgi:hypothetical protein